MNDQDAARIAIDAMVKESTPEEEFPPDAAEQIEDVPRPLKEDPNRLQDRFELMPKGWKEIPGEGSENFEDLLKVDLMELDIGYDLIKMMDPAQGGLLPERIMSIRRQMAVGLGMAVLKN